VVPVGGGGLAAVHCSKEVGNGGEVGRLLIDPVGNHITDKQSNQDNGYQRCDRAVAPLDLGRRVSDSSRD
jgi:hypothetical protein